VSRAADLEARRILARYRRLVLLGRARIPLAEARRLVGPDCAFHLYFRHSGPAASGATAGAERRASRRVARRKGRGAGRP
jgi:hypothetical protein